ncbi:MAG: hypothetical protein MH252_19795 [Thermosynechococcaceae cyanobacterium MS004]|nr:hypothetical protein [Thermosynechococcaceae cyanobacterium MS004]
MSAVGCGVAGAIGAIGSSAFMRFSLGNIANMGATLPLNGNSQQSFMLEVVLALILMFAILGSGLPSALRVCGSCHWSYSDAGNCIYGANYGASVNPVRSLVPAGSVLNLWVMPIKVCCLTLT